MSKTMLKEDALCLELFEELNTSVPRYTSYPTAPQFISLTGEKYQERLSQLRDPVSLYIHIPFCERMCLFCACSVTLNRKKENRLQYLEALFQEMDLIYQKIGKKRVSQLHLGGGTPTSLNEEEFCLLWEKLQQYFIFTETLEASIEIDPRTVYQDEGKKLTFLKNLGFNRVSFGIQDLNEKVQEAIKRRQSAEMSALTLQKSKSLGFSGTNVDLIYGLPFQTLLTFSRTIEQIIQMSPDRIALFSYAHVPWLKPHQKALSEKHLPCAQEKLAIYREAKKRFCESGYVEIGMDHFAKPSDSLTKAYEGKKLLRNFQGYTINRAQNFLGLGVTSIGEVENCYVQNVRTLQEYYEKLSYKKLPVFRGYFLQKEDRIRRWVIGQIMCYQKVDKQEFFKTFQQSFEEFFVGEKSALQEAEAKGLILNQEVLQPTSVGKLFLRNIASIFDSYYKKRPQQYAKGI